MFVIAFAIMVMLVSVLTFIAWTIRMIFFPNYDQFSPILVTTGLLSIVLGIIDSFVIPAFESLFVSLGSDLPVPTIFLFGVRHLLWLPTLWVIGLWYASKTWQNRIRYLSAALFTEIILLFLVLSALYAPIFKLGCA
jgi:magnesium-transporting ATPase (P-type)